MKSSVHSFVTKKAETLRHCTLFLLCALAFGLMQPPAAAPVDAALPLQGMKVALDAGHGGADGGARAQESGLWEKEMTLAIAHKTADVLRERGASVILTRESDKSLASTKRADLQKRVDIGREADVFLSIHLNEYRDRAESGPQVFYQQGGEAGKALAEALQQALVEDLKPSKVRKAMAGDYYVLRGPLPSALVECGFLSNAQEEKKLLDAAYQQEIARAIADGLELWKLTASGS